MPLLRRQPFERRKPPPDLKPDEEVFYCKLTNEIFRDYDEFYERMILCNSLVWSCSVTGKPNLTYTEALASERNAQKILNDFPPKLKIPVLYLAHLTHRTCLRDLADDVFFYVRDRYFAGERVEVEQNGEWSECRVLQIVPPTDKYCLEELTSGKSKDINSPGERDYWPSAALYRYEVEEFNQDDDDVSEVRLVHALNVRRVKGTYSREKNRLFLKQYTRSSEDGVWRVKSEVVKSHKLNNFQFIRIFRGPLPSFPYSNKNKVLQKQNSFSDDKNKLRDIRKSPIKSEKSHKSLDKKDKLSKHRRQSQSPTKTGKGPGRPPKTDKHSPLKSDKHPRSPGRPPKSLNKDSPRKGKDDKLVNKSPQKKLIQKKLTDLGKVTTKKGRPRKVDQLKESLKNRNGIKEKKDKKVTSTLSGEEIEKEMKRIMEQKNKMQEEKKQKALEEKQKRMEEREKKKEEKRRQALLWKEWSKPRDDLECDDLKDLPDPATIQCRIPNHIFGDFVMVLEFLHVFRDVLGAKDFFPGGVNFDILERALVDKEVAGPYCDIVQLLLSALFKFQEEEEDEIMETVDQAAVSADLDIDELGDVTTAEIIKSATAAATWSKLYQGLPLRELTLDAVTLTEVLRLHLLSSGGRSGEANSKWRYQQRGGYTSLDDPGLHLRIEEPQILRALSVTNVYELSLGDKLKILACLMNQILTYAAIRDYIDERGEKTRQAKMDLRLHQWAEMKREREAIAMRIKKKKEQREKAKEQAGEGGDGENKDKENGENKENRDETNEEEAQMTPEEQEAQMLKKEKEAARRKQEYQKKEQELHEVIMANQSAMYVSPLGLDRAYRRYWLFNSLPGIFVEHDDEYVGPCLPQPTPGHPELAAHNSDETLPFVQKLFEEKSCSEEKNGSSDKENDVDSDMKPNVNRSEGSKKLFGIQNVSVSDVKAPATHPIESMIEDAVSKGLVNEGILWDTESKDVKDQVNECKKNSVFGMCIADDTKCTVHCTYLPKTKWSFFSKEEELDCLIKCLNARGFRESELRQALVQERQYLSNYLKMCPVHKLDQSQAPVELPEPRKSSRHTGARRDVDPNLNFPAGTPTEDILEFTLRDLILDMEDKIHLGSLGSLKVNNRDAWRAALECRMYDAQCEKLLWGNSENPRQQVVSSDSSSTIKKLMKSDGKGSRPGTPDDASVDSGMSYSDPSAQLLPQDAFAVKPVVKDLACAILQVAQSIEPRYFQKPLGEDEKENQKRVKAQSKKKEKDNAEDRTDDGDDVTSTTSPLERWETSLMACTSLSQLFLHFSTLDNTIAWSKSSLNARCRICRRKGDGEKMLLCDGCNKGHHMYCLKPNLTQVPEGDWFCISCRPREKVSTPRKSRRLFSEESDEEGSDEEEAEEETSGEEEESEAESVHNDTCDKCGKAGHVICCDICPRVFHMECIDPPMKRVPRGKWACPKCSKKKSRSSADSSRRALSFGETSQSKKHNRTTGGSRAAPSSKPCPVPKPWWGDPGDESLGRRRCATEADKKISNAAKRLRSDSWDETESCSSERNDTSSDKQPRGARRGSRRHLDDDPPLNTVLLGELVNDLMHHKDGWPFLRPVARSEAPDYHQIIKRPMDLGTMKYKLNLMDYTNNSEFIADALLVFENCKMYNQSHTDEYKAGIRLCKFFQKRCRELGLKLNEEDLEPPQSKKSRRSI